jgi:hypothetical protein
MNQRNTGRNEYGRDRDSVDDTRREEYERRGWRSGSDYYGNNPRRYGERGHGVQSSDQLFKDDQSQYRDPGANSMWLGAYGNAGYATESERSFNDRWENSYGGSARFDESQGGRQRQQFEQDLGSYRGRGPRGYRRSDDRIREEVCECLTNDEYIDASDIEITVKDCEVTLSGTVDSRQAKRHAEDLAEQISGVRDVHNSLRVNREAGNELTSGQLERPFQSGPPSPRH